MALVECFRKLADLIQNPAVFSLFVHRFDRLSAVDTGKMAAIDSPYGSESELIDEIQAFLETQKIPNPQQGVFEFRLDGGVYISITRPPVSPHWSVTVEFPNKYPKVGVDHFLKWEALNRQIGEFLKAALARSLTVLVVSNDHPSRRVFLNALTRFTLRKEHIVAIDADREIYEENRHVTYLNSTLPKDPTVTPQSSDSLISLAQRMGGQRLILDTLDQNNTPSFFAALDQGIAGMSSIYAPSPELALTQLIQWLDPQFSKHNLGNPEEAIPRYIHLIVQIQKGADHHRRVLRVDEVVGGDQIGARLETIFEFLPGTTETGTPTGTWRPTGYQPQFQEFLAQTGRELDPQIFRF